MPTATSQQPDSSIAYRRRIEDVFRALGANVRQGLTDAEAESRLER
jgi:hypothetical protein